MSDPDSIPRATLVAIVATMTGLGLYSCSGNQDQQTAAPLTSYPAYSYEVSDTFVVTSTARYPSSSLIAPATATAGAGQSVICEETPSPLGISLISVAVEEGAAGHLLGAATATWSYSGDISTGEVTFSITSNSATHVVTFLDGEMTTNSYITAGKNIAITTPTPLASYQQQIPIPAAIGPSFSQGWTADMLVNGVLIGQCRAGL